MESIYLGSEGDHTLRLLVGEHLAQDLTPYGGAANTAQAIALENLQRVRKDPYGSGVMQNLAIGDQLDKTAHDLAKVSETWGVGYICEMTTRYHGLNIEKLKSLQMMVPGVKLMFGYTPKVNYIKET